MTWSIELLRRSGCSAITLVVPKDFVDQAVDLVAGTSVQVVEGGASRQESVANGLGSVQDEVVLVHDAARPFVDPEMIAALFGAIDDADGTIPVVPVGETIKEIAGEDVARTIDRANLFLSQTPQLFRTHALKKAHERAQADGFVGTDDAQLVERNGGAIRTVPGSRRNIKLTYPEDFDLAERMVGSS